MQILSALLISGLIALQAPAPQNKSVWDGVFSGPQAARGKAVFEAHCALCHANDLSGDSGPVLKGSVFIEHWREDNLNSLFTRLRTSVPARSPGSLTEPEMKAALAKPLGMDTYKLLYVDSFRAGFSPDPFKGHKMEAKGFLIRKPDLRLSVTWLESVADNCMD